MAQVSLSLPFDLPRIFDRGLLLGACLSLGALCACSDAESPAGGESSAGGSVSTGGVPGSGGVLGASGGVDGGSGATGGLSSLGGSSSGGSDGNDFSPCPATGPCKVLPLGDSITVGLGFDGGYRVELFRRAVEDGHEITFLGTQTPNGPSMVAGVSFPRNHEGISGETIAQIAARIPQPGLTEMPHIILLHAGTNDMVQGPDGASDRLGVLLDKLIDDAPDALLVVSNIIPLPFAAALVSEFNATIPGLVQARAEAGAHVLFVDQFDGFPASELYDNVHPDEAGYNRMAAKWYSAIEPYLR